MTDPLLTLKQQILQDSALPLRETASNLVIGQGNHHPKVLFLGEAPGKTEDLSGKPFAGAAGKILDQLLESINLTREEVFITSIVMYRPPKNRPPKPTEIAAFQPYLDQLIKTLNPPIIATLGKYSLEKFLPGKQISTIHGQPHQIIWNKIMLTILPLYHPAAVLYKRKLLPILLKDFQQLKQLL